MKEEPASRWTLRPTPITTRKTANITACSIISPRRRISSTSSICISSKEFPFVILEDPFNEDDYDTTAALTKDSGIQIVGDDLFTTNIRRVAHGVTKGAANTVLLKVNQIGTISEALEMIQYAYKFGYAVMPSDSRGEGESIADYAVGINAGSVRECGIGPRANRFMEIEAELGKTAKFLGARGLKGFKNQQRADALERKE